jgi:hypothetical protein
MLCQKGHRMICRLEGVSVYSCAGKCAILELTVRYYCPICDYWGLSEHQYKTVEAEER